ncbi:MAG: putative damage inducible protein, partial [Xanthobacteraceae bacterium]
MPASNVQTFRAMAYNNAWANHRLLTACAALTRQEFTATRTGFFPSLAATLNHILIIDWFYVDALEGGDLGPKAWANEIPHPLLADLKREQTAVDRRLIAICESLTDELLNGEVRVNRVTRWQVERRDRLLMHLFQHQVHHRG